MPFIADSKIHGHGVFADKKYSKGDTIEFCPYLIIGEDDISETSILHDYLFGSPYENDTNFYAPLGFGMVYNHSSNPNAEWELCDSDDRFIKFFALKNIERYEEILHDYGTDYWESRKT